MLPLRHPHQPDSTVRHATACIDRHVEQSAPRREATPAYFAFLRDCHCAAADLSLVTAQSVSE